MSSELDASRIREILVGRNLASQPLIPILQGEPLFLQSSAEKDVVDIVRDGSEL